MKPASPCTFPASGAAFPTAGEGQAISHAARVFPAARSPGCRPAHAYPAGIGAGPGTMTAPGPGR